MADVRMCVLDDEKVCDNCGECDRCDLDPNKICDNCCRCIAIEDEGNEFRSMTIDAEGIKGKPLSKPRRHDAVKDPEKAKVYPKSESCEDEPIELTPELVEYWERKLVELGEAPADDGFGEIEVSARNPVYGKRIKPSKRRDC